MVCGPNIGTIVYGQVLDLVKMWHAQKFLTAWMPSVLQAASTLTFFRAPNAEDLCLLDTDSSTAARIDAEGLSECSELIQQPKSGELDPKTP